MPLQGDSTSIELPLWLHPLHLDADWPSPIAPDFDAASLNIGEPTALKGLGQHISDFGQSAVLTLANQAAHLAATSLEEQQTSPAVLDAFASRHALRVIPSQRCLEVRGDWAPSGGGSSSSSSSATPPTSDARAEVRIPLIRAEVAHCNPSQQRYAIAIVPREPDDDDDDLVPGSPMLAELGVWLLLFDGDDRVLLEILDTLSSMGAIRKGLQESYALTQKSLGSGGCATVYFAHSRGVGGGAGTPIAMKLAREGGSKADRALLREMPLLLGSQGHPNIVRFFGLFRAEGVIRSSSGASSQWALALEFCSGGDLQELVAARGPQSESTSAKLATGVLSAIAFIHERGIVHRDIKSENVLLSEGGRPVLTDFGVAAFLADPKAMATRCGSAGYVAPEVLKGHRTYDAKVDVFGLGVTLYFMLSATLPFAGHDVAQVLRRNLRCNIQLETNPAFRSVDMWAKNFLVLLLQAAPENRPSASEALLHTWLAKHANAGRKAESEKADGIANSAAEEGQASSVVPTPPVGDSSKAPPRRNLLAQLHQEQQQKIRPNASQPAPVQPPQAPGSTNTASTMVLAPAQGKEWPSASEGLGPPTSQPPSQAPSQAPTHNSFESHMRPKETGESSISPTAPGFVRPESVSPRHHPPLLAHGSEDHDPDSDSMLEERTGTPRKRRGMGMGLSSGSQTPSSQGKRGQRILGALAAGMGFAHAPNFELQVQAPSEQVHRGRRFRLLDSFGGGGHSATSPNNNTAHSTMEDDVRSTGGPREWESFGCFSDASGVNTPRESFTVSSFNRNAQTRNSFKNTKPSSVGGGDNDSARGNPSHDSGSFITRMSWGKRWHPTASNNSAISTGDTLEAGATATPRQEDGPAMGPRLSFKVGRRHRTTGPHSARGAHEGNEFEERNSFEQLPSTPSPRPRGGSNTSSQTSAAAVAAAVAAAQVAGMNNYSSSDRGGQSPTSRPISRESRDPIIPILPGQALDEEEPLVRNAASARGHLEQDPRLLGVARLPQQYQRRQRRSWTVEPGMQQSPRLLAPHSEEPQPLPLPPPRPTGRTMTPTRSQQTQGSEGTISNHTLPPPMLAPTPETRAAAVAAAATTMRAVAGPGTPSPIDGDLCSEGSRVASKAGVRGRLGHLASKLTSLAR